MGFPQWTAPLSVTTDASGDATAYTTERIRGKLVAVKYTADGSNAYANGVDMTVTEEDTAQSLLVKANVSASFTAYPRAACHLASSGAALVFLSTDTAPVTDLLRLGGGRIKIALAQGGDTKVGSFRFLYE